MNIFVLIVVGLVGVGLGMWFARRGVSAREEKNLDMVPKQTLKKEEGKEKILETLRGSYTGKIANDDVQALLGVSDATATRYLDGLEDEGKIVQVGRTGPGRTGKSVHYSLK